MKKQVFYQKTVSVAWALCEHRLRQLWRYRLSREEGQSWFVSKSSKDKIREAHFSTGMALRMGCILDDLTSDECSIDVVNYCRDTFQAKRHPRILYIISLSRIVNLYFHGVVSGVSRPLGGAMRVKIGRNPWSGSSGGWESSHQQILDWHVLWFFVGDVPTIETSIITIVDFISIADKKPCYAQYFFEISGHCDGWLSSPTRVLSFSGRPLEPFAGDATRKKRQQRRNSETKERQYSDTDCNTSYSVSMLNYHSNPFYPHDNLTKWHVYHSNSYRISLAWIKFSDTQKPSDTSQRRLPKQGNLTGS